VLAGAGDHLSLLHALELRDGELAQVLLLLDLDHGDARRRRARSSGLTALHVLQAVALSWRAGQIFAQLQHRLGTASNS
jgi:hypothetical protein